MKNVTPVLILLLLSFSAFAQTQKVQVFCHLDYNGNADYGMLAQALPDSIRENLFIDPHQYHLNGVDALLLMSLGGWKLASLEESISGTVSSGSGVVYSTGNYLLKKDIDLDAKGRALMIERLKAMH